MGAAYSFVSRWEVPATPARCWSELERMLRPGGGATWWPGVTVPVPPPRMAPGEQLVLAVRSPLGYRLRVLLTLTEVDPGRAIAARGDGDLRGEGRVSVEQVDAVASVVVFHWDVTTERAWMNRSAPLLRPVFRRAHAAVMRAGERGLRAALDA